MWILFITLIEVLRFAFVLSFVRDSTGLFRGSLGIVGFLVVDWVFFFILLPLLFRYYPLPRLSVGNALGKWLRARVHLRIQLSTPDQLDLVENQPYIFACHSHGVIATAQLLTFMLRATEFPSLGTYSQSTISTVSSQLWALPLTNLVCRILGARSVSSLHSLIEQGNPVVISTGGAPEISLTQYDTPNRLHILKNTGFLTECFIKKRPIVPLLTLDNYSMYHTPNVLTGFQWQSLSLRWLGYGMPIFAFGAYGTIVPLSTAKVTIVQFPAFSARNDEENFESYVDRYYDALTRFCENSNIELVLVDKQDLSNMLMRGRK